MRALAWQKLMEAVVMSKQQHLTRKIETRKCKTPKVPGYSRLAVVALLITALAMIAGCAQQAPQGQPGKAPTGTAPATGTPATSAEPSAPGSSSATGSSIAAGDVDLSIALTEAPGAAPRHFRLVANGPTPAADSTLPDSTAALAAVEAQGEKLFFPVPDPTRACTQQYGGPEIAVVTGWFHGKKVNATFKRTDGCEIASWAALAPLFGALAGGTGAI